VRKALQSDSNRDAAGLCNGLKIYSSARILQMPLLVAGGFNKRKNYNYE